MYLALHHVASRFCRIDINLGLRKLALHVNCKQGTYRGMVQAGRNSIFLAKTPPGNSKVSSHTLDMWAKFCLDIDVLDARLGVRAFLNRCGLQ